MKVLSFVGKKELGFAHKCKTRNGFAKSYQEYYYFDGDDDDDDQWEEKVNKEKRKPHQSYYNTEKQKRLMCPLSCS